MSQTDFKHITVSTPDDDDVVVWAGQNGEGNPEEDISQYDRPVQPVLDERTEERVDPAGDARESLPPAGSRPRSTKQSPAVKRDEYRPTTLEDLEREPMPKVQRIVIIAAVVCIIGAIVYCILKMG